MIGKYRLSSLTVLQRYSRLSRQDLLDFQSQRLRELVYHGCWNIPFYRRLYSAHGVRPETIGGLKDLHRIPMISKRDLVEVPAEDKIADGFSRNRLLSRKTNGSTGEPFEFYLTRFEDDLLSAFRFQVMIRLGMKITDRQVRLRLPLSRGQHFLRKALNAFLLLRTRNIDTRKLPEEILGGILHYRPHVISGLASLIYRVAEQMTEEDRRVIRPRFIMPGADTLTAPMKRTIEEGFGAPVRESYASHEFNLIAWECPLSGEMHVQDASVILEVIREGQPAKPGEKGEVILTSLHSFAQPFIRYRLDDIVTQGNPLCPCGSPLSTILGVEGRVLDRILFPGDRLVSPDSFFARIHESAPWVRQYRIIQENRFRITVQVVPFSPPSIDRIRSLEHVLREGLPEEMKLYLDIKSRLEPGKGGKFRVSENRVLAQYNGAVALSRPPASDGH